VQACQLIFITGLLNVHHAPGMSNGNISMEPTPLTTLLEETLDRIKPRQKAREHFNRDKAQPNGKNQSHNRRGDWTRQEDQTCQDFE